MYYCVNVPTDGELGFSNWVLRRVGQHWNRKFKLELTVLYSCNALCSNYSLNEGRGSYQLRFFLILYGHGGDTIISMLIDGFIRASKYKASSTWRELLNLKNRGWKSRLCSSWSRWLPSRRTCGEIGNIWNSFSTGTHRWSLEILLKRLLATSENNANVPVRMGYTKNAVIL